jgi:hypothetical protein
MREYLTGEPKPYEVRGKFHPDRREYVFVGKILRPPPDPVRWGVVLGDVLHNFRSALDHLVWQLVLLSGKKGSPENQFPICDRGATYWSIKKDGTPSTRDRCLKNVAEEYRAIIDFYQPYRTRHLARNRIEAFAGLRDLSNYDKHRLVHLALFAVDAINTKDFALLSNEDAGDMIGQQMEPLREDAETEVLCCEFPCPGPNPDVSVRGELPIGVGFGVPPVRLPAFFTIADQVEEILGNFAPVFP